LVDDPDLESLRSKSKFRQFIALHFCPQLPGGISYDESGDTPFKLMLYGYYGELIAATGKIMEARWHRRTQLLSKAVDVHEQRQWWEKEKAVWKRLADVCQNYRHWPSSFNLIATINNARDPNDGLLCVPYPSLRIDENSLSKETESKPGPKGTHEENVKPDLTKLEKYLLGDEASTTVIDASPSAKNELPPTKQQPTPIIDNSELWIRFLTEVDMGSEKLPGNDELIEAADQRAGLWQALAEWYTLTDVEDKDGHFARIATELMSPRTRGQFSKSK